MKKSVTAVAFGVLVLAAFPAAAASVKVWHDIQAGKPSEVRAEGVLRASPEDVWKQIIRLNDYARFMPHVLDSFFIVEEGIEAIKSAGTKNANKLRSVAQPYKTNVPRRPGGTWEGFVFMVLNAPFPVENRWYVLRTVQDETDSDRHRYKRCWSLVIGNIESAQGCWILEPGERPGETIGRYEDQANPGGKVPEWVTRLAATQAVPEMFEKVEKAAQSGE